MDLLNWKTINSNIKIVDTKKKFYNEYFYCVKYFCPSARLIRNPKNTDLHMAVKRKLDFDKSYQYNYGGSWHRSFHKTDYHIDVEQLIAMREIDDQYKGLIKIRIEEPDVIIYSADENLLYSIAINELSNWKTELQFVSRPRSEEIKQYLDRGCVLIQRPNNYKYKIVCKSGACQNKQAIVNYLYQLDDILVTDAIWTLLENTTHNYIWNVWFYANDPNIADFLNIIEPNFVKNIHEVVVTE